MHPIVDAFWQGRNKFKNKLKGDYFDDLKKPKQACHLGAIYYGYFKKTTKNVSALLADFPDLRSVVDIPCEHAESLAPDKIGWISSILVHLNDEHDKRTWPDEKIASWLEKALA